ncbi:MobV family relaxase [Hallella absiana]|uniref:MobV family relaxase n=2 Tax=Hallella absiana TaxID=2925336 RepID=UPI0021CAA446|nr:MobV family relaxase [Hallella absiana]
MDALKPKAAVHGQPQKAFSKNASDENERWRWEQEMYARKNADLDKNNHYDYSRKRLNFEIVKGEIKPLGLQDKRLHERLQDKLEELGFKCYKDGAQNMPNSCVDWVFSGDHDRMCEMAFGASYKDIDYTAEKDNSEAVKNTDAYKFTASGYSLGAMPNIYQWALDSYRFACEKWGEDYIIGAEVHLDETTPHMHLLMVPVAERKTRGRTSTKYQKKSDLSVIIKKKEYETLSDAEKANYAPVTKASKKLVSYSGVFGDNYGERKQYMKDFHTEYHEKVGKKYGLERGDDLDLLDPEERRKRRHMRKDQLHAVQEYDKKLVEQAERNQNLELQRDELDRAIKDKQSNAAKIDKAIEKINATLANVKEELAAAKEDIIVYSYEAKEAEKRRNNLDVENSELEESIRSKSNHLNSLKKKIKLLPTEEQLNERERRNNSTPALAEIIDREKRDKAVPSLKDIIAREKRDAAVPSLASIMERERRNKSVPSLEDIIAREQRDKAAPSLNDIIAREKRDAAVPSLASIMERERRDKLVPSLDDIIAREQRDKAVPSLNEIERREENVKNSRINYYKSFVLPKVDDKLDASVELSTTNKTAVFAAVNGEWLNGVVLTKEQIEDYNDGYATAEQLAALLLSPKILKKVDEIQTAKTKQEIDSLQEKKLKLETEIAELKKQQSEILKVYNTNKELYDKFSKEYADYQNLVKTMITAFDYRANLLPGAFQALIESEGIPERSEYDERPSFTGYRWGNGRPYVQIHTIPDHTTYIGITQEDYERLEEGRTTIWEFVNRQYAPIAVKSSLNLEQQFGINRGSGIRR